GTGGGSGTTHYVATTGSDSSGDGTDAHPWATVDFAYHSAAPGDAVLLKDGHYTITTGCCSAFLMHDASKDGAASDVVIRAQNGIGHVQFTCNTPNTGDDCEVYGASHVVIQDINFTGSSGVDWNYSTPNPNHVTFKNDTGTTTG